jgi:hypothetical protein
MQVGKDRLCGSSEGPCELRKCFPAQFVVLKADFSQICKRRVHTMRSFGLILALAAMLLTNSADAGHKCCKPAKCKPVKCKVVKCCKPAKVKCCKPEPTCCSAAPACEVAPTCCAPAPSCSNCGTSACGAGGCAVAAPAVMATEAPAAAPVAPAVEEAPAPPAEPAPAK